MMLIISISFFINLLTFTLMRNHILMMLLSLEFMIITLFTLMSFYLVYSGGSYFSLLFMVMSVCEGVLGLSLLVVMIRNYGNDYFQSFSILW